MMRSSHITAAIAHERERELRHAAEAARTRADSIDDHAGAPLRRRLIERVLHHEDRECAPEPARAAR